MNSRGNARIASLLAAIGTAAAWSLIAVEDAIPRPEGFWPQTWAGWATVIGLLGTVWLILGPFLKERLRRFLCDHETSLLLARLFVDLLKTDDVGLVVKAVVMKQFPERWEETEEIWDRIHAIEKEVTAMRQSFAEVVEPALRRIEESTARLQLQLAEARTSTSREIQQAVQDAKDEFRDHGGRRTNPR